MREEGIETIAPLNRAEWRKWLAKNHNKHSAVWLVYYKKTSGKKSVTYDEAVDEALCFGWIDSTARPVDEERYRQFFSKRKPKGTWSKINKTKIERLVKDGLMAPAGLEAIATAKKNGAWTILDEVEELVIPQDLEKSFKKHKGSKQFFESQSKSVRKMMLQWLVLAKRPETRQKRIDEIVTNAAKNKKPKQF